jgi:hypothetical protein
MLPDRSSGEDFWCPAGENMNVAARQRVTALMTRVEWAALSRLATGEWLSDAQIERLQALGLAEVAFGKTLLTRLGRATVGIAERR